MSNLNAQPVNDHAPVPDRDVLAFRDPSGRAITGLAQLNVLLRAVVASWQLFDRSIEHTDDPYLAALFRRFAAERHELADELARSIIDRGGSPQVDAALLAELNCVWLQLRAALFLGESGVILDQVRADEEALLRLYDEAIGSSDHASARPMLERQRASVERSLALTCDMRATYRPAV